MRPRSRTLPRVFPCLRSLALGVAALGGLVGAQGAGAPRVPVVVADLTMVPTSPSFRMGMRRSPTNAPELTRGAELPTDHGAPGGPAADAVVVNVPEGAKPVAKAGAPAASSASAASPGARAASGAIPAPNLAAEAKAAAVPATRGTAPAASRAALPPADVLEHLRQRLAEKLGATPAGGNDRYVMRVSNGGESGENIVSSVRPEAASANRARRAAGAATNPASAGAPASEPALHGTSWDYGGPAGPAAWGRLPGFEKCANGTRQSPIDIHDGIAVDLDPIRFEYQPGAFSVTDNGHTVQVDVAPGNAITVMGRRYELVQAHFHRPAEERIDGRAFDMGVHLVHKDAAGRLAVVAVLLEKGAPQPVVQAVWNNLPLEKGEALQAQVPLDPAALLPEDRRYYTYMGSLTTPPCSEGVLWLVMKQPVSLSPEQDAIFAHLYPMNARPLQPAAGRLIKAAN